MTFRLQTLRKRADFLRARNGRYFATPGLVLQVCKVQAASPSPPSGRGADMRGAEDCTPCSDHGNKAPRFGFTATKKLGNAVVRNRIKRRLREVVRLIAPQKARAGYEYVLIGRKSTLKRPFSSLLQDLTIAFAKVHGKRVHVKRLEGKNPQGRSGKNRSRHGQRSSGASRPAKRSS